MQSLNVHSREAIIVIGVLDSVNLLLLSTGAWLCISFGAIVHSF